MNKVNEKIASFVYGKVFNQFILLIIIINAVVLGLDTNPKFSAIFSDLIYWSNEICLGIFTVELILKLYVSKLKFFKNGWNLFDFLIVSASLFAESSILSVFRIFRLLRVLRIISVVPKMQRISTALINSIKPMLGVAVLLGIVYYVYAVLITNLYGADFPEWFGSFSETCYTLFQIMTFESWSMGIVRPIMEKDPNAWAVFISFIIIATYVVLNLVIGIIVDSLNEIKSDNSEEQLHHQIHNLEKQLAEIKALLLKQK
ncbi:ion transporter [Lonepinella sp. BR2474]|uniref:ion transporter n=1 Tax=unclassified Lonepinella TaxID=2642006 RepID=UPI003F6E2BE8